MANQLDDRLMRQVVLHLAPAEIDSLTPQARGLLFDRQAFNGVIAACLIIAAHDIPDPRQTYRGPWTPGWTPM